METCKKHKCPDCSFCQFCSETRCRACRGHCGAQRKLSIDELPQLINVVIGDMSLVGPRPLPLYEVEAFAEFSHRRRLSVKPGITCEWQAGGRNKITSFDAWVEMDLKYIDNWSLWLDLSILLRTIPAVLFGKGAK